jgi:hypothetical protein
MGHEYIERAGAACAAEICMPFSPADKPLPDPLGEDRPDDDCQLLSDRQLARVVFVAAETGHRFGREGRSADPAAWMYAPRRLFAGEAPVAACTTQHGFVAAMLLHGVWPELDAEPAAIEDLLIGDEDLGEPLPQAPQLFTALVSTESSAGSRFAFYAVAACDEYEARNRLSNRIGIEVAELASLRPGFDATDPIGRFLLPEAVHHSLGRACSRAIVPADLELLVDYRTAP